MLAHSIRPTASALRRVGRRSINLASRSSTAFEGLEQDQRTVMLQNELEQSQEKYQVDLWSAVFGRSQASNLNEDPFELKNGIPFEVSPDLDETEDPIDLWSMVFARQEENTSSDDPVSTEEFQSDRRDELSSEDLWGQVFGSKQPECMWEESNDLPDTATPTIPLKDHDDVWTSVFGSRDI